MDTSGSFLRKITSSRASRLFSNTIFPSLEANTTPPELQLKKKLQTMENKYHAHKNSAIDTNLFEDIKYRQIIRYLF